MSGWRIGRPTPKPERTLRDWMALSSLTAHPKPTGNPMWDMHNEAIAQVQAYLNGKATAARADDEREYLLRLRADLNWMHLDRDEDSRD